MQIIEGLTDAEIAEAHRSKDVFDEVRDMTAPLDALLSLIHALDWLRLTTAPEDKAAHQEFLTGQFGDPVLLATGKARTGGRKKDRRRENGERAGMKRTAAAGDVFDRFRTYSRARRQRTCVQERAFLQLAGRLSGRLVGLGKSKR